MKLTAAFSVPLPVADAWTLLQDVERVAAWFPGARLDGSDGDSFTGSVRVKVGPMVVDYKGVARFVERDESEHRVVLEASGREQRGQGTAKALATTSLQSADGRTDVSVSVDLDVTGRPAQLGQSLIQDIAGRLVGEFSARMEADLSARASSGEGAGAVPPLPRGGPGAGAPSPRAGEERAGPAGSAGTGADDGVLDLGRIAGPALLRRSFPLVAAVVACALAWRSLSRRCRTGPTARRCR
ncbi:MAG: SRPBCC family protein [Actinomycetota bacterium]|nr:SRPBCC family protein [Actinomycetota bacterium]